MTSAWTVLFQLMTIAQVKQICTMQQQESVALDSTSKEIPVIVLPLIALLIFQWAINTLNAVGMSMKMSAQAVVLMSIQFPLPTVSIQCQV